MISPRLLRRARSLPQGQCTGPSRCRRVAGASRPETDFSHTPGAYLLTCGDGRSNKGDHSSAPQIETFRYRLESLGAAERLARRGRIADAERQVRRLTAPTDTAAAVTQIA